MLQTRSPDKDRSWPRSQFSDGVLPGSWWLVRGVVAQGVFERGAPEPNHHLLHEKNHVADSRQLSGSLNRRHLLQVTN